jgi:transposase InsO family protein
MKASEERPQSAGRPRYSKAVRFRGYVEVARQRKRQGRGAGWRPIKAALKDEVPTRLVQEAVSRLKARDRKRHRKHLQEASERVEVLVKDGIWSQDGMHAGRCEGVSVEAQVMKDRGTYETLSLLVGPSANAQDVVLLLKATKEETGTLPLVWQTDNASIYLSEVVQAYLREERVVPLLSRVHCPTDNGAAEIGIRELKTESSLGKGCVLDHGMQAAVQLGETAVKLNRFRLRGSKGYLASKDLAENMPSWYNVVDRNRFYEEACKAMERAVQETDKRRARKQQREAVLSVLEKYGLIKRTRGGRRQRRDERVRIL